MAVDDKRKQDWMDGQIPALQGREEQRRATGQGGILMEPISNESP
ncbi:hypothetical protein FVEG_15219 [Fusarium verticillioides 7600]|uniref:Uncharacterized protein n=1 Tax=Gibberella moniliformis (strain M3125 / FGSC 7600) TaxID=334819 RepID=W7M0L5_GIBM7|nr:hypothetical protein FVEG_15219 [Fusarium verticillioides 7600]EWG41054.1 hypothetical protein FVEG_15219 [Fusarium verticillioides 7600]